MQKKWDCTYIAEKMDDRKMSKSDLGFKNPDELFASIFQLQTYAQKDSDRIRLEQVRAVLWDIIKTISNRLENNDRIDEPNI